MFWQHDGAIARCSARHNTIVHRVVPSLHYIAPSLYRDASSLHLIGPSVHLIGPSLHLITPSYCVIAPSYSALAPPYRVIDPTIDGAMTRWCDAMYKYVLNTGMPKDGAANSVSRESGTIWPTFNFHVSAYWSYMLILWNTVISNFRYLLYKCTYQLLSLQ